VLKYFQQTEGVFGYGGKQNKIQRQLRSRSMKTLDLPREQWRRFCDRVTELHRGALVTITVESEGETRTIATKEPLQSMKLDEQSDQCNDVIVIETGEAGQKATPHRIIEPVHIRLKNGNNDRYNHVHMLAESGKTEITFNPGLNPAMVGEFAPANAASPP
jgi:Family of unknown function (DUF5335)